MNTLVARIEGIGFWSDGLPSWEAARGFVASGHVVDDAPARPTPALLAPNERRRAPQSVAVALDVALAACTAAGREPSTLPSVFASAHGDLAITDYMCATLASAPRTISPTRFHNSVHNAAAGYWTIGTGCLQPATAVSALHATFAQALLEALSQVVADGMPVLLVAYDTTAVGPLGTVSPSAGLLGGALVLATGDGPGMRLRATLVDTAATRDVHEGRLARHARGNAMAPMLPLFDALAIGDDLALLDAGDGRTLRVELADG
ncbi:MAG TPA: beta-ketoacyl synthase chain length factor [Luteimonas sp.]|nr:beta-ketoacyl synthase chain length factor [Luteimonas sp.]